MSDEDALRIVVERRGTMYDPLIVDTFVRCYQRVMPPADAGVHPAARALDEARRNVAVTTAPAAAMDVPATDEVLLAFNSLSRAFCGDATLNDVGALVWMMVRQAVPCQAMVLFVPDEETDSMAAAYAAGTQAATLGQLRVSSPAGVVGWAAVNRRAVANAAAAIDTHGRPLTLRWTMATPLVHEGALVAVLSLYSEGTAFAEDQARLIELLAPRVAAAIAALEVRRAEPRVVTFERSRSGAARFSRLRAIP